MPMLTKTRPEARPETAPRSAPKAAPARLERRWFKVEGKLECRYVTVHGN